MVPDLRCGTTRMRLAHPPDPAGLLSEGGKVVQPYRRLSTIDLPTIGMLTVAQALGRLPGNERFEAWPMWRAMRPHEVASAFDAFYWAVESWDGKQQNV